MSGEADDPNHVEALRLEIERLRYENERFRTHLERWRTDVEPLYSASETSRNMAFQFAQTAIKSMFLLNGGALIAFPAFAELVDIAFVENLASFLISAGAFVVGLVLITLTTVLAYKAMDADAEAIRQNQEMVKIGLNRSLDPKWYTDEVKRRMRDSEQAQKRYTRRFQKLSIWSLGLGIGSLITFVIGAIFAAVVLSSAASANYSARASADPSGTPAIMNAAAFSTPRRLTHGSVTRSPS